MIHGRLKQNTGNEINVIYGIPSLNQQSNGENKSGSQSILVTLCQLLARQLERMVISSRILV